MTDAPGIEFQLWPSAGPGHIAVATLNVPATLNSLDLTMVDALAAALVQWRDDPAVAMVYLRGAGDRAFCAGGDIQALYRSCKANREAGSRVDSYAEDFFEREYRLDYVLHTFPKPVLCFGHGVVMGGGLGLLAASRFRVVTPKSRVAMPEITIGLFRRRRHHFFLPCPDPLASSGLTGRTSAGRARPGIGHAFNCR